MWDIPFCYQAHIFINFSEIIIMSINTINAKCHHVLYLQLIKKFHLKSHVFVCYMGGNCFLIRKIWVNLEMYLIFPSHFIPCKEYKNDTKI